MKSLTIVGNLLRKNSPASSIEMGLLDGLAGEGVKITALCSSLGELNQPSQTYRTLLVKEKEYWIKVYRYGRHLFPDLLNIPDYHYFSWGKKTVHEAEKLMREEKFDIIHSFSHPSSCHLVAYELQQKSGLPWIATFFDSWTDYPSLDYCFPFFRKYNEKLERKVAENATLIIHNNEGIANLWKDRYGEEVAKKIVVIPLNEKFDEAQLHEPTIVSRNDVLNMSHVGTFYPFRNAQPFIEGVRSFVEHYPQYRNKLRINFVGQTLATDIEKINAYNLTDLFNIMGRLSSEECEQIYKNSDVLLATAMQPFENYTYPSKIIKYFYYRKPILGICPDTSVLYDELTKSGHSKLQPEDSEGISDFIYKAITDYPSICDFDKNYWRKFSIENVVKKYVSYMNELSKS